MPVLAMPTKSLVPRPFLVGRESLRLCLLSRLVLVVLMLLLLLLRVLILLVHVERRIDVCTWGRNRA